MKPLRIGKKLLAVLLAVFMVASALPMSVFAEEIKNNKANSSEVTEEPQEVINEIKQVVTEDAGKLYYYNVDNSGLMTLDRVEDKSPVKRVLKAFKAPKASEPDIKAEIDWTKFDVADLVTFGDDGQLNGGLVYWMMNNTNDKLTKITDKNGTSYIIRGASNYDVCIDANHDKICDECGYCITACVDGTVKNYTEDDIDSGKTKVIDGVTYYYNEKGIEIGHDVKDTIKYNDGTEKVIERVQYETYSVGADKKCDVCGKEFCTLELHSYVDGYCDICGLCAGIHTDTDNDGKCDRCGKCVDTCKDEKGTACGDGICDVCTLTICESCEDNGSGVCSVCGKCIGNHTDEAADGKCDACGACTAGCKDETGGETGNGICDICGYCMDKCVDSNNDAKCDVCSKVYSTCDHVDISGANSCLKCDKKVCGTMDNAELAYAVGNYAGIMAYLSDLNENADQPYDTWLNGEFANFLATGKDENGNEYTGIGAKADFRHEIDSISQSDILIDALIETVNSVDIGSYTAETLIGSIDNDGKIVYGSSLYGQIVDTENSVFKKYDDSIASLKYAETKNYSKYKNYSAVQSDLKSKVQSYAALMLENEFAAIFGAGYQKGSITINSDNYSSLKSKCADVDEVLFALLSGSKYKTDNTANDIWTNKKSLPAGNTAERYAAMYGLVQRVEYKLRELRELSYTNFEKFTYDENGSKPYAIRELFGDDLTIDEENIEQFEVWEEDITKMIRSIDGLIASQKFVDIAQMLLKENGFELDVTDQDGDGQTGLYDLLLSLLVEFVFKDDLINTIFESLYPTVTGLFDDLPNLFKKIGITPGDTAGVYTFDLFETLNAVGVTDLSEGAKEAIRELLCQVSGVIALNGAHGTPTFREFLAKSGIVLYPDQIANLIAQSGLGTNSDAYKKLAGKTSWNSVLDSNKKLDIKWNIKSLDDFKDVLSVLFASFGDIFRVLIVGGSATLSLDNVAGIAIYVSALLVAFESSSQIKGKISLNGLTIYQDVITPIFEALGLADFGTMVGDPSLNYKIQTPYLTSGSSAAVANAKTAANAIIGPLFAFLKQLSSHPIEKILSILPNIAFMLENGKLLDLFDIGGELEIYGRLDFFADIGNIFDNVKEIITKRIMKHWYDWLNPLNYARIVASFASYLMISVAFGLISEIVGNIDVLSILDFIEFFKDLGKLLSGPISKIVNELPGLFEQLANMFGLHISDKVKKMKWDGSGVNFELGTMLRTLNFSTAINGYLTSDSLASSFGGLNFAKMSTLVKLFLDNLVDDNGNKVTLIDTKLLDLDKLAHLGSLEKKSGSIRTGEYTKHWNSLSSGQYYFVSADAADVFYFFVDLLCGTIQNKDAVKAILGVVGMEYDTLSNAVSGLGDELSKTTSLELNSIVKDATDKDGKLSLDKIISHLSTNNVICIMSELINGIDLDLDEMNYIESTNKEEIDANGGKIPYLEYNTQWTKDVASFIAEDIDNFADELIQTIPFDLDPSTADIETLRQFAKPMVEKLINNPSLITPLVKLLSGVTDLADEMMLTLVKEATEIDASVWANDFGYLFDEAKAKPATMNFEKLSGKVVAKDEEGNPVIEWTYDGKKVEDYKDIFAFLGELLSPVSKLLDLVFCGKDFNIMQYDTKTGGTGALATVKGNDGYNFAILPVLEAMLPETANIPTPAEFAQMGTMRGLMAVVSAIVDFLMDTIDSDTFLADLAQMGLQLMYVVSGEGVSTIINDLAQPLLMFVDYLRPILNIDINEVANSMICQLAYEFAGYASSNEMRSAMKENGGEIDVKDMTLSRIFNVIGVFVSSVYEGKRSFLDVGAPISEAMNDVAYLKKEFKSKGYALDGGERTAAKLNISGKDAFTSLVSMVIETIAYKNNPAVIDAFASNIMAKLGLVDKIAELLSDLLPDVDWADILEKQGIIATVLSIVLGIEMKYSTNYNWLYVLGKDATDAQKEQLYSIIKSNGSIKAKDYQTEEVKEAFNKYLASYATTTWDEGTATYLVERLGDMIDTALNIELEDGKLGDKLLGLLEIEVDIDEYNIPVLIEELLPTILTDDLIDKILAAVSDTLNGKENDLVKGLIVSTKDNESHEKTLKLYETILEKAAKYKDILIKMLDVIGVDLAAYDIDITKTKTFLGKVTYYNADGEKTGLERHTVSKKADNFGDVIGEILAPLNKLLSFALLGKNLEFLNTDGVLDSKARRDSLINVDGLELYEYMILPLAEALGVEGMKSAETYKAKEDGATLILEDLIGGIVRLITDLSKAEDSGEALDKLFDLVPSVLYYLNSGAIGVYIDNTVGQINSILDIYNAYAHREGKDKITALKIANTLLGLELTSFEDLSVLDILEMIPFSFVETDENGDLVRTWSENIYFNDFVKFVLENFSTGEIYKNTDSKCTYDTYSMRFENSIDKAETITILVSAVLDIVEDPDNKGLLSSALGEDIYQTLENVLNLKDFNFEMQDFSWIFTEYADTNKLLSAFDFSSLFDGNPYSGKLWTREMAADMAENLTQFINDMLYLLGLEYNGILIRDFNSLMYALVGSTVYSNDLLNLITSLLGQIKPLLDKYDPDGAIAGFVKELLDIDVHAWDEYAPGGKYENGRDWGFDTKAVTSKAVRANSKIFENALSELLSPIARVLTFVLCEDDFTFFMDGDGLGKNSEDIQLTICGAQGYKYALVPLFEAMNVDGTPDKLVAGKRDGDIYDPDEFSKRAVNDYDYAIEGVVHPLVSKINDIMDSTATELLELLPSIVYFINSNGIDTVVKNLLHSVYVIGNAIRPVGEQIDMLVYDEYGINIYKTIHLDEILNNTVFSAIGITMDDVAEIYAKSGAKKSVIDGLEDLDFRMLFSIGLAAVNGLLAQKGIAFKFTSIAASAVEELTYGYVRSFNSLSGRKAYTMILGKDINKYCYGDLLSILMRVILKFLSVDDNSKALVELVKLKFDMSESDAKIVSILANTIAWYTGTLGAYEVVMYTMYYTIYGASQGSDSGVGAYDKVNGKWANVIFKLENLDNPIAKELMKAIIAVADGEIGDIIGSDGIAGNGLIRFFRQIADWFKKIIETIKQWFK